MPGRFVPTVASNLPRLRGVAPLLLLIALLPAHAASGPGVRAEAGVVVAPEPQAAEVGLAVLRSGGNAVDAAVATALALSVTHPEAGSLGGGGFALVRSADRDYRALDFREVAPAALDAALFLDEEGRPDTDKSLRGGLAVGVPGTVAGLHALLEAHGTREWRGLVQPAERLAREGFPVPHYLAAQLGRLGHRLDPAAAAIFLPGGAPPRPGAILRQPELAAVLKRIGRGGPSAFYDGPLAERLVARVREAGGVMTLDDLRDYRVRELEPLVGSFRGHAVVAFPPPSSGGVALLQMLEMLEQLPIADDPRSSATLHRLAEVQRRAFADRSRWLGDPAFTDVPLGRLLDADYLAARAASIDPARATPSTELGPGDPPAPDGETMHLSVADRHGNVVAMTITLNQAFGNGIVVPGSGILLNNEIDDFALAPGVPNFYGLVGDEANRIEGGKRPLSSMTPAIVEQHEPAARPLLVLGSPGGSKIISAVLQVLLNVVDHGMAPQQAVDAPRIHHQWLPDVLGVEPDAISADVRGALEARGHDVEVGAYPFGCVNAIGLDDAGRWIGAADPRRESVARGY